MQKPYTWNYKPSIHWIWYLTLEAPAPRNGRTYSMNCLSMFDHFKGLALTGLRFVETKFYVYIQIN